jgi:hypothetical protein
LRLLAFIRGGKREEGLIKTLIIRL